MVPKQQQAAETVGKSRVDNCRIRGPDSTVVNVVNSVNILPDYILFVKFHSIAFICNDNSRSSHHSGTEMANLHIAIPHHESTSCKSVRHYCQHHETTSVALWEICAGYKKAVKVESKGVRFRDSYRTLSQFLQNLTVSSSVPAPHRSGPSHNH